MNVYTATFQIKEYLACYLEAKWGVEIRTVNKITQEEDIRLIIQFPPDVIFYHLITNLSQKRPKNVHTIYGNIEIRIPRIKDVKNKKPETHNFINKKNAEIFEKKLDSFFKAEMNEFMDTKKHEEGMTYKDASYLFLSKYGIDDDLYQPDSVRRHHARWRDKVRPRSKSYTRR